MAKGIRQSVSSIQQLELEWEEKQRLDWTEKGEGEIDMR